MEVGAVRCERHLHRNHGLFVRLLDGSRTAEHDQVGQCHLLAILLCAAEVALDAAAPWPDQPDRWPPNPSAA